MWGPIPEILDELALKQVQGWIVLIAPPGYSNLYSGELLH